MVRWSMGSIEMDQEVTIEWFPPIQPSEVKPLGHKTEASYHLNGWEIKLCGLGDY